MAFERKVNQAGLFHNDNGKSDYSGQIDVACPHCGQTGSYWLNGWNKLSKAGMAFISLTLKPKVARGRDEEAF